jgi:hypothetical protein
VSKLLISGAVLAASTFLFAGAAKADTQNIQLGCVSVTCVSNGSILTTQSLTGAQLDLTGNSNAAGELFIAIYVPVSTGGGVGNFTGPKSYAGLVCPRAWRDARQRSQLWQFTRK